MTILVKAKIEVTLVVELKMMVEKMEVKVKMEVWWMDAGLKEMTGVDKMKVAMADDPE